MKQKGINFATQEFENSITNLINSASLPASTIRLVLAKLLSEISAIEQQYVEQERAEFLKPEDENKEEP